MNERRNWFLIAAVAAAALALGNRGWAAECDVPPDAFADQPAAVATRALLTGGKAVAIVTVGSSSTVGAAAGGAEFAWPARLASELRIRHPGAEITVHNRAVRRSTAQAVLGRFEKDVLMLKPALVIWETGTGDAVAGVDLDVFRDTLQAGIDKLSATHVEVVFMDPQFSQRTEMIVNFARYAEVLEGVAGANAVGVFPRRELMRAWAEDRVFDYDVKNAEKRQQLARRLYDCIGKAVADFIDRDLKPQPNP